MFEDLPPFIKETARKVIVSKFKFFNLKLWEFARLFAAMACVNLVFRPTHRERKFVVELKLKLLSLFHYEQIVWENSDIKWMKVPSFS